jgi:hypothetical protein
MSETDLYRKKDRENVEKYKKFKKQSDYIRLNLDLQMNILFCSITEIPYLA